MHIGNIYAMLGAWLSARSRGDGMLLRIEDIDEPRVVPGAAELMMDDLHWLGLDWDGDPVFQVPDWTGNASLSYGVPLASGRLGFTASASYRSATQQFESPIPVLDQAAFWLYDASITWNSDDDTWQLGLHGRNLTDERYITSGYNFPGAATDNSVLALYGNPRTVTLTATYRFN